MCGVRNNCKIIDMKKFSELQKDLGPNALYRFVPLNQNSLQSIINRTLYFGDPHFQNDPIDSSYILDISLFPIEYFSKGFPEENPEDITKSFLKITIDDKLKKDYGICCFSRSHNGILLWSHYSKGAAGFCYIFDRGKLLEDLKESNDTMKLSVVNYNHIPTIKPLLKHNEVIVDYEKIVFNKIRQWYYESEVRILCILKEDLMHRKIRVYKYKPKSLRGILIGERMRVEDIITIKNLLKLPDFKHLNLYKKTRQDYSPNKFLYKIIL
jgi:hypothetical protein